MCNLVEIDLASSYKGASRAVGTAGTTPFNTADTVTDFANVLRILDDNGAPPDMLQLVLDNAAIQNLRGKQSVFFKANEAKEYGLIDTVIEHREVGENGGGGFSKSNGASGNGGPEPASS